MNFLKKICDKNNVMISQSKNIDSLAAFKKPQQSKDDTVSSQAESPFFKSSPLSGIQRGMTMRAPHHNTIMEEEREEIISELLDMLAEVREEIELSRDHLTD